MGMVRMVETLGSNDLKETALQHQMTSYSWLRVRIWNSAVFNFSTTVLAIRLSLRNAAQLSSAKWRGPANDC